MADEEKADSGEKKGMKGLIMIGGMLVVEAVAIIGLMLLFSGEPDVAVADALPKSAEELAGEKIEEILVLDGRLPNDKAGPTMLYDTEIFVQVKRKYAERVHDHLAQFQNELKFDLTTIWKNAEPRHFKEARLESLTRKVEALLKERFGADEEGMPIVDKVVIVMGTGLRMDI